MATAKRSPRVGPTPEPLWFDKAMGAKPQPEGYELSPGDTYGDTFGFDASTQGMDVGVDRMIAEKMQQRPGGIYQDVNMQGQRDVRRSFAGAPAISTAVPQRNPLLEAVGVAPEEPNTPAQDAAQRGFMPWANERYLRTKREADAMPSDINIAAANRADFSNMKQRAAQGALDSGQMSPADFQEQGFGEVTPDMAARVTEMQARRDARPDNPWDGAGERQFGDAHSLIFGSALKEREARKARLQGQSPGAAWGQANQNALLRGVGIDPNSPTVAQGGDPAMQAGVLFGAPGFDSVMRARTARDNLAAEREARENDRDILRQREIEDRVLARALEIQATYNIPYPEARRRAEQEVGAYTPNQPVPSMPPLQEPLSPEATAAGSALASADAGDAYKTVGPMLDSVSSEPSVEGQVRILRQNGVSPAVLDKIIAELETRTSSFFGGGWVTTPAQTEAWKRHLARAKEIRPAFGTQAPSPQPQPSQLEPPLQARS